jgi:hypothetical protein
VGGSLDRHERIGIATLYKVLHDWFPGAAQLRDVQVWKGARPMLPDGPPVLGASGAPGVWLNLGHGSSGWALSCGSARVLADLLGGRGAAIDLSAWARSTERCAAERILGGHARPAPDDDPARRPDDRSRWPLHDAAATRRLEGRALAHARRMR